jgi:hypothetical protein
MLVREKKTEEKARAYTIDEHANERGVKSVLGR